VRNFDPTCDRNGVVGVHRVEVITGVGGRRSWSAQDKGRIVAETLAPGANVSEIARRYRLRPQQVYDWRRLARRGMLALPTEDQLGFVPIVAADDGRMTAAPAPSPVGAIEIAVGEIVIRTMPGMDWRLLRDVLRAVKAVP
jgi:transposase